MARGGRDDNFVSEERPIPLRIDRLVGALTENNVDFIVVGGWAVVRHGSVRATKDVDICPNPDPENLTKLMNALNQLSAEPILGDLASDAPVDLDLDGMLAGGNWVLATDSGRLDIMQYLIGENGEEVDYQDLADNTVKGELFGHSCRFCSLEDLLSMKKGASRPQDLIDVQALTTFNKLSDDK